MDDLALPQTQMGLVEAPCNIPITRQLHYHMSQMLATDVQEIKLAFQSSFSSPFNKIEFHEQFEVLVHIVDTGQLLNPFSFFYCPEDYC